MMMQYQSPWYE